MKPFDRISLIVIALLEPAIAAGMPESEAKAIYQKLMRHFSDAQAQHADFAELLADAVQCACIHPGPEPTRN